eukprot:scaffold229810_cov19-Tisochrysis_lutea.AAC.2
MRHRGGDWTAEGFANMSFLRGAYDLAGCLQIQTANSHPVRLGFVVIRSKQPAAIPSNWHGHLWGRGHSMQLGTSNAAYRAAMGTTEMECNKCNKVREELQDAENLAKP